jgi:ABC-type transport system involved in multi-copper enzyme maturation permease subunit
MGASLSAELLKLRKRPATWILAVVFVTIVLLLGYGLTYSFVANPPPPPENMPPEAQAQQEGFAEQQLNALLPENMLSNLFGGVFGIGGALALILGALTAGSEYGWGTLKGVLSQGPGRLGVLFGKLAALGLFLLLFVGLALAAAALGSFAVARLEDAAVEWPPVSELLRGFGAGTLILAVWGALGFALAVLFRGTALAIGLGLSYALAVENVIASLPIEGDTFENIRRATLGENTIGLSNYFGSPFPPGFGAPEPLVEPGRAVLVLSAYAAFFVVVAMLLLWRRDVT